MIEVEIPKDITKFESKTVGPFSTRQAVCILIAAPIILGSYFLFDSLVSDTRLILSATLGLPILAFGWFKPYGMKLEDFLKSAFATAVLSPKNRLYQTENIYGDEIVDAKSKNNKKDGPKHVSSSNHIAFE